MHRSLFFPLLRSLIRNLEQFIFEGEVTVRVIAAVVLEIREVIMHATINSTSTEAEEIRTHILPRRLLSPWFSPSFAHNQRVRCKDSLHWFVEQ